MVGWKTAADLKASMIGGVQNCAAAAEAGAMNPRRNPMVAAAERIKDGTWKRNFLASMDKWAKNVAAVSLTEWKKFCNDAADFYASQAQLYGADNWAKWDEAFAPKRDVLAKTLIESKQGQADFIAYWEGMRKAAKEVRI